MYLFLNKQKRPRSLDRRALGALLDFPDVELGSQWMGGHGIGDKDSEKRSLLVPLGLDGDFSSKTKLFFNFWEHLNALCSIPAFGDDALIVVATTDQVSDIYHDAGQDEIQSRRNLPGFFPVALSDENETKEDPECDEEEDGPAGSFQNFFGERRTMSFDVAEIDRFRVDFRDFALQVFHLNPLSVFEKLIKLYNKTSIMASFCRAGSEVHGIIQLLYHG